MQAADPMFALVSALALGWLTQKLLRAPSSVPSVWSYVAFGGGAVLIYLWATPNALGCYFEAHTAREYAACVRGSVTSLVTFYMTVRGSSATAKDTGIAPATDSK